MLGLGIAIPKSYKAGALASAMLLGADGLALASKDDSMQIISTADPTDNYSGTPGAKLTTTRASGATYWDANGVLQTAGNNVLRRDFDPRLSATAERCGYLIEEARTNLALRSEDFSTSWSNTRSSETVNAIVAPDGTTTADKIVEDATAASSHLIGQGSLAVTSGTAVTVSFFLKAGERTIAQIKLAAGFAVDPIVEFDLVTGAFATRQGTVADRFAIDCGNGWWRCGYTSTPNATTNTTAQIFLCSAAATTSYDGDGASGLYAWGAQFEAGSFASSYIPTAGSTVTRAADLVTLAGTLFPLSQTEGTLYAKFMNIPTVSSANAYAVSLNDGTINEFMGIAATSSGPKVSALMTDGGVAQLGSNGLTSNGFHVGLTQERSAFGYKLNDCAVAQLGETVQTDIICTLPTTTTMVFGNLVSGTPRPLHGWLFEAAYFPTRKTNSQLQALASGYASDALLLMGAETQGLTFSATDQSMSILDTGTPANAYTGELSAKLGSIRTSAGMTYLSSGLLGWGPENLVLRSQEFDNASWDKSSSGQVTITANAIAAPDGTLTADLAVPNASSGYHRVRQTPASIGNQVQSIYVKASGYSRVAFREYITSGHYASFLLSGAGSVLDSSGITGATITALSDGWYRISGLVPSQSAMGFGIYILNNSYTTGNPEAATYTGDGVSGVYIWGAQCERAASASTYKPTTSAAYYGLRLDYDSRLTGGPGYLVEEARTNLCLRSQEFDNASWAKTDTTITANDTAAPDGTITADLLTEGTAGTALVEQTGITIVSNSTNTVSRFFKRGNTDWVRMLLYETAAPSNRITVWANLATGALGTPANGGTGSGATGTIQAVGNGFYRVTLTGAINNAATSLSFTTSSASADSSTTKVNNATRYEWGAQMEAGAFATSYIPTTTASVTRAADIPTLLSAAFPLSQTEGTLVCRGAFYGNHPTNSARLLDLSDGTSNERVLLHRNSSSRTMGYVVTDGGSGQVSLSSTVTIAENTLTGSAAAYKVNDCAVVQAGESVQTDATATMPTNDRLIFGNRFDGQAAASGWLRHGRYFPRRASNSELATMAAAA